MKKSLAVFLPVMLCFFTMGFVDLVGIASNYVHKDLGLTDAGGTYLIIRLVSGEQLTFLCCQEKFVSLENLIDLYDEKMF